MEFTTNVIIKTTKTAVRRPRAPSFLTPTGGKRLPGTAATDDNDDGSWGAHTGAN